MPSNNTLMLIQEREEKRDGRMEGGEKEPKFTNFIPIPSLSAKNRRINTYNKWIVA